MTEISYSPEFNAFWDHYPRRIAKAEAWKAWQQLRPARADLEAMIHALAWQVLQPEWLRDGGRYVPHAATWLRARRWEDEPFHPPQVKEIRETKQSRTADAARSLAEKLADRIGMTPELGTGKDW